MCVRPQQDHSAGTWYLLLQIGLPVPCYGEPPGRHLRIIQQDLRALSIVVRRTSVGSKSSPTGRYLFRFGDFRRDDAAATRLAEGFLYGISLLNGPMVEDDPGSLVLRLPTNVIHNVARMNAEFLVELERCRPPDERVLRFPRIALSSVTSTTSDTHEAAWRIAVVTFQDDALFDATRFLKRSHDNFHVYPTGS